LPRSKKAHIFVFVSCIVTALSRNFAAFFSLVEDSGEATTVFGFGDLAPAVTSGMLVMASLSQ
jgi:hypothetical protein